MHPGTPSHPPTPRPDPTTRISNTRRIIRPVNWLSMHSETRSIRVPAAAGSIPEVSLRGAGWGCRASRACRRGAARVRPATRNPSPRTVRVAQGVSWDRESNLSNKDSANIAYVKGLACVRVGHKARVAMECRGSGAAARARQRRRADVSWLGPGRALDVHGASPGRVLHIRRVGPARLCYASPS